MTRCSIFFYNYSYACEADILNTESYIQEFYLLFQSVKKYVSAFANTYSLSNVQ